MGPNVTNVKTIEMLFVPTCTSLQAHIILIVVQFAF